jgi:hypothetical protein
MNTLSSPNQVAPSARVAIGAVLASLFVTGCADEDHAQNPATAVSRDSSGVEIVYHPLGVGPRSDGLGINPDPLLVLAAAGSAANDGDGTPAMWGVLRDVAVLADGRIVVADGALAEVTVLDTAGSLIARFGGRGSGPGEMRDVRSLHICAGDSIAVENGPFMDLFDSRGTFFRRVQARTPERTVVVKGVSSDCNRLLVVAYPQFPPVGSFSEYPAELLWLEPSTGELSPAGMAPVEGWTRLFQGTSRAWPVPWAIVEPVVALLDDKIVVGRPRVPDVAVLSEYGQPVRLIRTPGGAAAITAEDRRQYGLLRSEWLADRPDLDETRFLFPQLHEIPTLPQEKPHFDRIIADDQGRLWVRSFPLESLGAFGAGLRLPEPAAPTTWRVFDSDGYWIGEVEFPEGFDLRAVARGRAYGIGTEALGVPTVRVYAVAP